MNTGPVHFVQKTPDIVAQNLNTFWTPLLTLKSHSYHTNIFSTSSAIPISCGTLCTNLLGSYSQRFLFLELVLFLEFFSGAVSRHCPSQSPSNHIHKIFLGYQSIYITKFWVTKGLILLKQGDFQTHWLRGLSPTKILGTDQN